MSLSSRPERSGVEGPCVFNLSSRPERSGVEGPCVFKRPVLFTQDFPFAIFFWDVRLASFTQLLIAWSLHSSTFLAATSQAKFSDHHIHHFCVRLRRRAARVDDCHSTRLP